MMRKAIQKLKTAKIWDIIGIENGKKFIVGTRKNGQRCLIPYPFKIYY